MRTSLVTAPTIEPIDLEEAKLHLRIDIGETEEDDLINALIRASRERCELVTGRKFVSQTWYSYYDGFPYGHLEFPYAPLRSIATTGVYYTNSSGGSTTVSSSAWSADIVSEPGRLILDYGQNWPSVTLAYANPVRIEFTCGYSTGSTGVPDSIKQAMKLMIGHWHENREESVITLGLSIMEIPLASKALLAPYKMFYGPR